MSIVQLRTVFGAVAAASILSYHVYTEWINANEVEHVRQVQQNVNPIERNVLLTITVPVFVDGGLRIERQTSFSNGTIIFHSKHGYNVGRRRIYTMVMANIHAFFPAVGEISNPNGLDLQIETFSGAVVQIKNTSSSVYRSVCRNTDLAVVAFESNIFPKKTMPSYPPLTIGDFKTISSPRLISQGVFNAGCNENDGSILKFSEFLTLRNGGQEGEGIVSDDRSPDGSSGSALYAMENGVTYLTGIFQCSSEDHETPTQSVALTSQNIGLLNLDYQFCTNIFSKSPRIQKKLCETKKTLKMMRRKRTQQCAVQPLSKKRRLDQKTKVYKNRPLTTFQR